YSFSDVLAYRFYLAFFSKRRKEIQNKFSFLWKGRSVCENCSRSLLAIDLIPIFSYWLRKGKCRYCDGVIAKRHFYGELASFLLGIFLCLFSSYPLITTSLFFILSIFLSWLDAKMQQIPVFAILLLVIVSVLEVVISHSYFGIFDISFLARLIQPLAWFVIFYILAKVKPGSMGEGDAPVVFAYLLSFPVKVQLFFIPLASTLGILFYLIFLKGEETKDKGKKTAIPFVPFLSLSFWILRVLAQIIVDS
ncbi:MAG: prepilin peptidase, partial [Candidatus Hydrogenedentota bacterium]